MDLCPVSHRTYLPASGRDRPDLSPWSAADLLPVALEIALDFSDRVAAELFQEGVGEHQRHHGLADHSGGMHDAHVGALVMRLHVLLGHQVNGGQWRAHGRDRLYRGPQVDRLAVGHAPGDAAGVVAEVREAPLTPVDLVVELAP